MNKIEIILADGSYLDVKTDIGFPLTYQIDDIRNPATANASHSKTIKLPGTKNNNIRFGGLFDINSNFSYFNPNIKTEAKIFVNGTIVMDGYFQLTKINKINNVDLQGNEIEYEIVFFENAVDIFSNIKGQLLTGNPDSTDDLDLSSFDHILNISRIEEGWNQNTWVQGYVYPLMFPVFDHSEELLYDISQMKPAIFHKQYLTQLITDAGYEVGGDFYDNNATYAKEIIPYNGKDYQNLEDTLSAREFRTSYLGSTAYADVNMVPNGYPNTIDNIVSKWSNDTTSPNFDNGNNFNTSNQLWSITEAGIYQLSIDTSITLTATAIDGVQCWWYPTTTPIGDFSFYDMAYYGPLYTAPKVRVYCQLYWNREDFGTSKYGTRKYSDWVDLYPSNNNGFYAGNSYSSSVTIPFKIDELLGNATAFYPGTTVQLRWGIETSDYQNFRKPIYISKDSTFKVGNITKFNNSARVISMGMSFSNGSTMFNTAKQDIAMEGETITMNDYIPKNIKKEDLLTDVIRRYNLFMSIDPSNSKKILLTTRDTFYSDDSVLDWTQKKDYNSPDKIELLTDLQNKNIEFTYKEGKDDANKNYKDSTGDIYGQKTITFTNEFVGGTKKIESIFSPTPLVYSDKNNTCIIPFIDAQSPDNNVRVLYWGGLKSVQGERDVYDTWKLAYGHTYSEYYHYPYAGHLDDPINPTIDINWGLNSFYYYEEINTTTNNLYNTYWANQMAFIADGKMVTSKFYLTEVDIGEVRNNLNKKIFVKDAYYYINKIKNYNPTVNDLTEVELLKIKTD